MPVLAKQSGGHGGFTCCVPGCFSNSKKNPELSFYNFYNYNFITLLDAFMPAAKCLVYYGSDTDADRLVSGKVEKRGSKRSLSLEQEFFLVLVSLRLGLLEVDFATRAGLSQSQLLRIFIIPNCDAIQFGLVENLLMKLCHHHLRRCIQEHGLSLTAQNCSLKLLALLELKVLPIQITSITTLLKVW